MTKSVLIEKVSEKAEGLTRNQTEIIVDTVFDSIKHALLHGEASRFNASETLTTHVPSGRV